MLYPSHFEFLRHSRYRLAVSNDFHRRERCFLLSFKFILFILGSRVMTRVTVFYLHQHFMAPTRLASWAFRFCKFYSFIFLHAMSLYFCISEQFTYFNKCIYTLYIVVLVVYSLIWRTTTPCGWHFPLTPCTGKLHLFGLPRYGAWRDACYCTRTKIWWARHFPYRPHLSFPQG